MAYERHKLLYFASAAPDGTAGTEEVVAIPANNISHYEMDSATRLNIFAKSGVGQEAMADGVNHIVVGLTIASGKYKEVLNAIILEINNSRGDALVVIGDEVNSKYIDENISAVVAISVVDAS